MTWVNQAQPQGGQRVLDSLSNIVNKKGTEQSLNRQKLYFPVLPSALFDKRRGKKNHKAEIKWAVVCT